MVYKTLAFAFFFANVALQPVLGAFDNPSAAGNGNGEQFITGKCLSDLDCDSGCCGFNNGLCAGAEFAQDASSGDGGCGFGNAQPNAIAAEADKAGLDPFQAVQAKEGTGSTAGGAAAAPPPSGSSCSTPPAGSTPPATGSSTGFTNPQAAGNGNGEQFITGKCLSDADCASGCCAALKGLCAGAVFATEPESGDGGCGFGSKKFKMREARAPRAGIHRLGRSGLD